MWAGRGMCNSLDLINTHYVNSGSSGDAYSSIEAS